MVDPLATLREEIADLGRRLDRLTQTVDSAAEKAAAAPTPGLLDCSTLQIHNGQGATPIEIRAGEEKSGIYLYDKEGVCRALLEITERGARFAIMGAEENPIVSAKGIDGHGQICVASPDGHVRAAIRSTKHGGVVKVLNEHGRPLGFLFGSESGGVLELNNQAHRTGVSLFAEDDGGMLRLHQGGGEVMASISAHDDSGMLTVFGTLGEQAVTLCASDTGGHVLICDPDGEVHTELT
jgi:hypothetical protein